MKDNWDFIGKTLASMMKQSDRLDKATDWLMIAPESPLLDSQGRTEGSLIEALGILANDQDDWVSWYVYECSYGRAPMEAGPEGEMRLIKTVTDLRWIIECGE